MKRIPIALIIIGSPSAFVGAIVFLEGIIIESAINDGVIFGGALCASGILLIIIAVKKENEIEVKEK